jgi:DNA gyrase subunit A
MEVGLVKQVNIDNEMRDSYLSYAMSVIVSRALPDVRDGLKPVQRRILYAMHDMRLVPTGPHRKSARVVGEVLGKYHPHGDQSVYDAMVRMAQDFSMRYPLVDGQGNFGSVDGDAAAAMRYTEARMTPIGHDMLEDLAKNTVDFVPNFDESLAEPSVLPATLPNLLINGSSGIAVGMATSVPPHNLTEVIQALEYMLDNWSHLDDITVSQLMNFIKGPDFPTGGLIFRYREEGEGDAIANAYATGRGRVVVRARAHIENMERSKFRIVITELPYQVNKTNLIARIADLHRESKLEGLTDLRDESDRNGMRIIIETTRNVEPENLLSDLFRLTPMQSTFSIIMVSLVHGEPRVLNLKQMLRFYVEHRLEIVRRRSQFDLARARERAHILEGLLVALQNLDAVIDLIRRSRNADTARTNLQKEFKLTEIQAQAILDMQLRRLAALERRKIDEEYKEKLAEIKELELLLASPDRMRLTVKKELLAIRDKYGDSRRSLVLDSANTLLVPTADMAPNEKVWVMATEKGTLSRTARGELISVPANPREMPMALLEANSQDVLYLFTAAGQAVSLPVYQLPAVGSWGEGAHWSELTSVPRKEHLATVLVRPLAIEGYLSLATVGGVVKRVRVEDLPGIAGTPFTVINVPDGDSLGWARWTQGEDEIVLATAGGQAIRFKEEEIRPMGLPAGGVMGIKLASETDGVVAMEIARPDSYLWSITGAGLAKATWLKEYPVQGRYGQGVVNVKLVAGMGEVVTAVVGSADTQLLIKTADGLAMRTNLGKTVTGARASKPRSIISLGQRNRVVGAVAIMPRPPLNNQPTAADPDGSARKKL